MTIDFDDLYFRAESECDGDSHRMVRWAYEQGRKDKELDTNPWMSVKTDVPSDDREVTVYGPDCRQGIDCYRDGGWDNFGTEITHWRELVNDPVIHLERKSDVG